MNRLDNDASEADILAVVFSDHSRVRQQFRERLKPEIDEAISALAGAYRAYRRLEALIRLDKRAAYVLAFAYTALNSLLTSLHLLISGLPLPSGNLMRHYGEAIAMALLCSHPEINTYELLEQNSNSFAFHKSLDVVNRERNRKLLEIDGPGWESFMEITAFYDRFSHASLFAVFAQFMFGQPGSLSLLGEFDPEKVEQYRFELKRRRSAAELFQHMIVSLAGRLPAKDGGASPNAG